MNTLRFIDIVKDVFRPEFYKSSIKKIVFLTGFFNYTHSITDFSLTSNVFFRKIYFVGKGIRNGVNFYFTDGCLLKENTLKTTGNRII